MSRLRLRLMLNCVTIFALTVTIIMIAGGWAKSAQYHSAALSPVVLQPPSKDAAVIDHNSSYSRMSSPTLSPRGEMVMIVISCAKVIQDGQKRGYSYWHERVLPIMQTWGAHSKENSHAIYFSFADAEDADGTFLRENCTRRGREGDSQVFQCPSDVNVVGVPCDGKYHGLGLTCRWEENLRWLLRAPQFQDTKWFMLSDDDVYIHTPLLLALLQRFGTSRRLNLPPCYCSRPRRCLLSLSQTRTYHYFSPTCQTEGVCSSFLDRILRTT